MSRVRLDGFSINEPYSCVSGGRYTRKIPPYSPDPFVNYRWDKVSHNDGFQIFTAYPISYSANHAEHFSGLDTITAGKVNIKVSGTGSILLDFGVEYAAWLEIDSPDLSGHITLGISEYNKPAFVNSGPKSPAKTAEPVRYGDTYRLELNDELYEGVRFGFINITGFDKPFHITQIRLVCQLKPANYNGSFSCDNELLNKIWYTAAYVLRVNFKKDYFAAILMDRGDRHSWTGDAYTAQAAALPCFANYDFVLENLHYTAVHPNGIESFELYWVQSLIDYYEYPGDKNGVRELLPHALNRLDHAYEIYGTNPPLGFFGWDERLGAGFEAPGILENQYSYSFLAIEVWKAFAVVLEDLGEKMAAEQYRGYAAQKIAGLKSTGAWHKRCGLHALCGAVNAGLDDCEVRDKLKNKYFADRVNRVSYSPFNEYFILQAMSKIGSYDAAISSILDLWGGQIKYGGTTFFETFRPDWANVLGTNDPVPNNQAGYTSLAHPWSAGVLAWLSEEILGIKAEKAGFKTFTVTPHLGRQLNRVSGEMPTPYGTISASFDMETGHHVVMVPSGTTATVGVPKAGRTIIHIKQNGRLASASHEDQDFIYFTFLTAGEYRFDVLYEGEKRGYIPPEYKYPADFLGFDRETKGQWGLAYGKDGYWLCGYPSDNAKQLPDYVSNIRFAKGEDRTFTAVSSEARSMYSNRDNTGARALGGYQSRYNQACYQTFTVDIDLAYDHMYTVALYFVDWEKEGKSLAVEMFDGKTFELVAPVRIVEDHREGVYAIYKYNRPARFRIDHIRGEYVSLSGLFFGLN